MAAPAPHDDDHVEHIHHIHSTMRETGYDPLSTQPEWGNEKGMRTRNPRFTEILHRAKFSMVAGDFCNGDRQRRYLHINENSIESNEPSSCSCYTPGIPFITANNPLGCFEVCALPPNACCPGHDHVKKVFFDRGMFDRQNCCWEVGFWAGEPAFFPNEIKHTVCCMESCPCIDQCMSCYCASCCGERVRYMPAEFCCWCVPLRTGRCGNCYGCCGAELDMPVEMCLLPIATGLDTGEAEHMVTSFRKAINEWNDYTGAGKFDGTYIDEK